MDIELSGPPQPLRAPQDDVEVTDIRLAQPFGELDVLRILSSRYFNRQDIFSGPITVEHDDGGGHVSQAEYRYLDGRFHLIQTFESYVKWPDSIDAKGLEPHRVGLDVASGQTEEMLAFPHPDIPDVPDEAAQVAPAPVVEVAPKPATPPAERLTPQEVLRQAPIRVQESQVLHDINIQRTTQDVTKGLITVEFPHGKNEVAIADYEYSGGVFRLVRKYDKDVVWPAFVNAEPQSGVLVQEDRVEALPAKVETAGMNATAVLRYKHYMEQIRNAQDVLRVEILLGNQSGVALQRKRLQANLDGFQGLLNEFPEIEALPQPDVQQQSDIVARPAEIREQLGKLDMPAAEKTKRVAATVRVEAMQRPGPEEVRDLVGGQRVRVDKIISEDLHSALRSVRELNNGAWNRITNDGSRHNAVMRVQSMRRNLERSLRVFRDPVGTATEVGYQYLTAINQVIDACMRVEQVNSRGLLRRIFQNTEARTAERQLATSLQIAEDFLKQYPQFLH